MKVYGFNFFDIYSESYYHKLMIISPLFSSFLTWRTKRNITRFVNWVQFDNTLLLDFDKLICIQLFLKSVQNQSKIVLEEFLFAKESVVTNSNNAAFTNQFILSFYKE